jgi:hypothetical protein
MAKWFEQHYHCICGWRGPKSLIKQWKITEIKKWPICPRCRQHKIQDISCMRRYAVHHVCKIWHLPNTECPQRYNHEMYQPRAWRKD